MKIIPLTFIAVALSLTTVSAQPQITVSGTADVRVVPDEVVIHVGVETRNEKLDQARHQHDDLMKSALGFLKHTSLPERDVQTDFINITMENYSDRPTVYVVRKYIEVKLTNVTNLESVLTGLLNAGVNRVDNVEFHTSQLRKYRDQARAMAVRAASEKADALCGELGVKRGKPLNINANESGGMWYPTSYMGSRGYMGNNSQTIIQSSSGVSDSPGETLSLGQITVSATVNVSFALQD
jgi:uncharacterized protein YggE